MTYPLIGNYGINEEDVESRRPWVNGFIVKEACAVPVELARRACSSTTTCKQHGIVGIQGIDTRALTRHLRDHGAQDGIISTVGARRRRACASGRARCPGLVGRDLVSEVTVGRAVTAGREGAWDLARGYAAPPRAALHGGRLRRGHQAQHPAPARARLGCG